MEYIIGFIMLCAFVILAMMIMTMLYHLLYGAMSIIAVVMIIAGLFIGFWNAVKNTISVFNEVYGNK